jgi:hypothetical protein
MIWQRHVTHRLAEYVDQRLSPGAARTVEAHLESCGNCRAALAGYSFAARLLRDVALTQAPDSLWMSITAALDQQSDVAAPKVRLKPDATSSEPDATSLEPDATSSQYVASGFSRTFPWLRPLTAIAALLAVIVAGAAGYRFYTRSTLAPWEVTRLDRAQPERLKANEWIQTGAVSGIRLNVGRIGTVDVAPGSRVRLVAAKEDEYRLGLAHGEISAVINAPPRLFFVDTPTSTVVDLGCAYTMRVDDSGAGTLRVTAGWASLEWSGRESLVPAGASGHTRPDVGPGTPSFDDATPALKGALDAFDFENGGRNAVEVVLAEARVRDTLTLWHLMSRVEAADRERVFNRIVSLTPLPKNVTKDEVMALNPDELKRWREELAWSW